MTRTVEERETRDAAAAAASPTSLRELALLSLRLGATAFGDPAAHVAMMQDEVVRRRGWMSEERFLDLLGATNLIPGPNSTEMAIHVGWARRRWAGLLVAGASFIGDGVLEQGQKTAGFSHSVARRRTARGRVSRGRSPARSRRPRGRRGPPPSGP